MAAIIIKSLKEWKIEIILENENIQMLIEFFFLMTECTKNDWVVKSGELGRWWCYW